MKDNPISLKTIRFSLSKSFVLLVCLLLSFATIAQESRVALDGNDPLMEYQKKNKDSQMVKLYQQNPDDVLLKQALRMSAILDNPQAFPEFSTSDLKSMQARLDQVNTQIKQIDVYMQEGDSYELAKAKFDRYQPGKFDQNTKQENSPTIQISK